VDDIFGAFGYWFKTIASFGRKDKKSIKMMTKKTFKKFTKV